VRQENLLNSDSNITSPYSFIFNHAFTFNGISNQHNAHLRLHLFAKFARYHTSSASASASRARLAFIRMLRIAWRDRPRSRLEDFFNSKVNTSPLAIFLRFPDLGTSSAYERATSETRAKRNR